jgi:hypothetical protein
MVIFIIISPIIAIVVIEIVSLLLSRSLLIVIVIIRLVIIMVILIIRVIIMVIIFVSALIILRNWQLASSVYLLARRIGIHESLLLIKYLLLLLRNHYHLLHRIKLILCSKRRVYHRLSHLKLIHYHSLWKSSISHKLIILSSHLRNLISTLLRNLRFHIPKILFSRIHMSKVIENILACVSLFINFHHFLSSL